MGKVITVKVNTKEYDEACKNWLKNHTLERKKILIGTAAIYAKYASNYVPPEMGQEKIDEKFYTRALQYLPVVVKRDYKPKEKLHDIEQLRKGYLFKIRQYLHRRKYVDLYFKKVTGKVKKLKKIINRGLLRVCFGADLASIGGKVPANIKRLMSKSKNLKKFIRFNKINFEEQYSKINIINDSIQAYSNANFAEIAVRRGNEHAVEYLRKKMKALLKANVKF